jgi:hypothetical protein
MSKFFSLYGAPQSRLTAPPVCHSRSMSFLIRTPADQIKPYFSEVGLKGVKIWRGGKKSQSSRLHMVTLTSLLWSPPGIRPLYLSRTQAAQTHYTQLFQHFPILERTYFPFEKNFHAEPFVNFAKATWPALPLALCTLYALMIVVGSRVMKNRFVLEMSREMWEEGGRKTGAGKRRRWRWTDPGRPPIPPPLLPSLRPSPSLSHIHIRRSRRYSLCRSRWSPYH